MARSIKNISEVQLPDSYSLVYEADVVDCGGHGVVLTHKKSGARICLLSNTDENKVFSISFRTPPTDSTGVAHILEHSVLCGSEKYPAKDPMMELNKGSLNTFINAFTYPDKTCYPVASCNDKDFANLCDVYMDAALFPLIYREPKIFKQEGWHYELNDENDPITLNGVVYSEMKGAFSSGESKLHRDAFSALFPDTAYGVESGGDPKDIPNLTYENFLNFHRRYYHPSNSYIIIYGNFDVEERLTWLDKEYLSKFDRIDIDSSIALQKPIGTVELSDKYPIGEEDSMENAAFLSWNGIMAPKNELMDNIALGFIMDALFNSPGAPIKDALIKAGVGQDISAYIDTELLEPYGAIYARNTNADKMPQFKKLIREGIEKAVTEGINRESLLAAINKSEFSYCEENYGRMPKGLFYELSVLDSWLYDDSKAFVNLGQRNIFPILREKLESDYFEKLAEKYMLNNISSVYYVMEPERGLGSEEKKELTEKLAAYKNSLTEEEIKKIVKETKELKAFQEEPSSPESLLTIPLLKREDIRKEADKIICEKGTVGGIETLYHEIETNGIYYVRLLFDLDTLPKELIPYFGIATRAWGIMDTKRHSYLDLDNAVNIHTGGISTDIFSYSVRGEEQGYRPFLAVCGSFMDHGFDSFIQLAGEEILETNFSDVRRLREIIGENLSDMKLQMMMGGHSVGIGRASAASDSASEFKDLYSGYEAFKLADKLYQASDEELAEAAAKIRESVECVLGKDNLTLDITCNREMYEKAAVKLPELTGMFGMVRNGNFKEERRGIRFDSKKRREALKNSGDVNFVCMVGNAKSDSVEREGIMDVVTNILSSDHLWNNVRVKNGAYGAGFAYRGNTGLGLFYSYRDPNIESTLDVYKASVEYLKNITIDEREMTKYIIGTIGSMDAPASPASKGLIALSRVMSGVTDELLQRERDSILSVTEKDVRESAGILEKIIATSNLCVVGNENAITKSSALFEEISNMY